MKQNNPCYLFGMYEPDTNSVIVNAINDTYTGTPLTISCEKCNSAVSLDTLQFTMPSGLHSVLERPFSEANGRPFLVKRSPLIVC